MSTIVNGFKDPFTFQNRPVTPPSRIPTKVSDLEDADQYLTKQEASELYEPLEAG